MIPSTKRTEQYEMNDKELVDSCLSECVAPSLAKKAFEELVDNAPFERIKRTPDENGWHYGLLKEDRPNMPEDQLKVVSSLLDDGWAWWDETSSVIGLNRKLGQRLIFVDVNLSGTIIDKSIDK